MKPKTVAPEDAIYAAIADEAIAPLGGFGNGLDKHGNAYMHCLIKSYPILNEYVDGTRSVKNAFIRYVEHMKKIEQ